MQLELVKYRRAALKETEKLWTLFTQNGSLGEGEEGLLRWGCWFWQQREQTAAEVRPAAATWPTGVCLCVYWSFASEDAFSYSLDIGLPTECAALTASALLVSVFSPAPRALVRSNMEVGDRVFVPVHAKGVGWGWGQDSWKTIMELLFAQGWNRKGTNTKCWNYYLKYRSHHVHSEITRLQSVFCSNQIC